MPIPNLNETQSPNPISPWDIWYAQPEKTISSERITNTANIHKFLLDRIAQLKPSTVIEVGIGTGLLYSTFAEQNPKVAVIALDLSEKILQNAKSYLQPNVQFFLQADTYHLPFVNLEDNPDRPVIVFHQGLLEHFDNNELIEIITKQLRVADTVIASVPSSKYSFENGKRGDERLLTIEDWQKIFSMFDLEAQYYGKNKGEEYHICMIIKNKSQEEKASQQG